MTLTRTERVVLAWVALAAAVGACAALWRMCAALAAWLLGATQRIGGAL